MEILNHTRKDILHSIAKEAKSASNIARDVKLSLPYTLSQLAILEAAGHIKKERATVKAYGKPRLVYFIAKSIIQLTSITKFTGNTLSFTGKSQETEEYLQLLSNIPASLSAAFSEYFWKNITHHKNVTAYGLLSSSQQSIELLAITTKNHLEQLRRKISHFDVSEEGKSQKIVCWVHTIEEIIEGTKKKDEYYLNIKKKITPILDREKAFMSIKEGIENE